MESLPAVYKKKTGKSELFSDIFNIDIYDGPVEAICKLATTEQWYVCSLVYFNIPKDQRIFTVLQMPDNWVSANKEMLGKFKRNDYEHYERYKKLIKHFYKSYVGDVFLFKSNWLLAIDYEVTKIPLKYLKHFDHIEDVLGQSEESQLKWISFF